MKVSVYFIYIFLILLLMESAIAHYNELSWKNADSLMSGDLRHRMKKAQTEQSPTRRRYCGCDEVDEEDNYPICASNGGLYMNACLFRCAQVRWPHLTEVDIADCGSHTFREFKQDEFRPHY
ncbi:hypothetical protein Ocin01_08722 [Orchesella cincta]|uniref:Kazal-like domain-containing protein n=1 Tax=Orchesella cincta TaxID=48709 RepID=A0A1D2MY76_ORCCI|nr:hypothetical protein Ocin01_08722 [Orchesella cincta]